MSARRVLRCLAAGAVLGLAIDIGVFWLAADFDTNLLSI